MNRFLLPAFVMSAIGAMPVAWAQTSSPPAPGFVTGAHPPESFATPAEKPAPAFIPSDELPMRSIAKGLPNMGPMVVDHLDEFLDFFKAKLAVSDGQMKEWNDFADAMHASARLRQDFGDGGSDRIATIPEWSDFVERIAALKLEELRQFTNAILPLYKVLSPEQRRIADELLIGNTVRK